jgi:hypothetical protein
VYRLTAFNPNSRYHLSIRVDYPNAHDRKIAAAEGRRNLGGDIFIHGKAVSIGCLAIGDTAIEELYVLLADAGLSRSTLLLAPSAEPRAAPDAPAWITDLYRELRSELGRIRGTWGADLEAVLGRSDEAAADGRPTRHEMIERPKDASVESPSEVP